ncbi:MAG: hypothetical protein JSS63_01430 [Bacteroidetes bacterium]|nr:hypothetical protein [Bacteroidota bacterium]MBX7045639.1 hypothetical protein [Ignavibacteria bacterium]
MLTDNLKEKLQDGLSSVTEKIDDMKENVWGEDRDEIIGQFKDKGTGKVKEVFQEIADSNALIQRSGFILVDLEVSLGLPPEIGAIFHQNKKVTKEEKEEIMKEAEDKKIVKIILNCLFKASDYYDKISIANYKLDKIELTLGLAPGIKIIFSKAD